jgi:hypothetical protein
MPHDVYAAKREGLRSFGALGDRALPFGFCTKGFINLPDGQAIDHVIFGKPAFTGDADSEPQILKALDAVGIRIDHTFNAFLFG